MTKSSVARSSSGLAELRALVGVLKTPPIKEVFPFSRLGADLGIPRGAVTEVSGPSGGGKTETVLSFLAENASIRVAWIEDELTAYPCAFPQAGVALERVLFVDLARPNRFSADLARPNRFSKEAGLDALWTTHQILRSQLFGIVVLNSKQIYERDLRRLQLSSEQAQASLILLSDSPKIRGAWPIAFQLEVNWASRIKILKGSFPPQAILSEDRHANPSVPCPETGRSMNDHNHSPFDLFDLKDQGGNLWPAKAV